MKTLSKPAQKTFDKIIEHIPEGKGSCRIDTSKSFMALSVEKLESFDTGTIYSLCHYFEQNGDLCRDPEMTFMKHPTGDVTAMTFQQDIPPLFQRAVYFDNGWKFRPRLQAQLTDFAQMWLRNIKYQQSL